MYRGQLMTALLALGCYSKAAAVRAGIDFASWAKTAGFDDRLADVAEWSEHEIAWAAGRTGESVPGESVPGDEGKDYASLGLEPGRSAEAAALAEDRGGGRSRPAPPRTRIATCPAPGKCTCVPGTSRPRWTHSTAPSRCSKKTCSTSPTRSWSSADWPTGPTGTTSLPSPR